MIQNVIEDRAVTRDMPPGEAVEGDDESSSEQYEDPDEALRKRFENEGNEGNEENQSRAENL